MDMTHILCKNRNETGKKSRKELLKSRREQALKDLTKKYQNKISPKSLDLPKSIELKEIPLHKR